MPTNSRFWYASTRNVTRWPVRISATSDSSTLAFACIAVRSAAMLKMTEAVWFDTTVWPTSTARLITTPSSGA